MLPPGRNQYILAARSQGGTLRNASVAGRHLAFLEMDVDGPSHRHH
jgi:hypothetical protein